MHSSTVPPCRSGATRSPAVTLLAGFSAVLMAGACTSQAPTVASQPAQSDETSTTTGAAAPPSTVVGPYTLTAFDPASAGVAEEITAPELAESSRVVLVTRQGRREALVYLWRLRPDAGSDPTFADRFATAAAAGAPVQKITLGGRPAALFLGSSPAGDPTTQVVQSTPGGELLLGLGTDDAALVGALDAVMPALTGPPTPANPEAG